MGGVLAVIFNLLHPRSSAVGDIEEEFELILGNGHWLFIHMGIVASLLIVFVGVVAIAVSMYEERGLWARFALCAAVASLPSASSPSASTASP
ncbi:MAG: hypothetical protein ACRD29_04620 [Acidimicrobiales bacterium]